MIVVHSDPVVHPLLGPGTAGLRMSAEEFDSIDIADCDEIYRYELIHGVLVVTPFSTSAERSPNELLGYLLQYYQLHHPEGKSLDATYFEHELRIGDERRRADRVIWAGLGRIPDEETDIPSIVVEFVSPGMRNWRRDYEEKRDQYLAFGVKEYWVIDRFRRTLTVFCQNSAGRVEQSVSEAEIYRTALLPGFELPLAKLLEYADRCKPPRSSRQQKEQP